ncbi:YwqG family protein [Pontibacter mangrovi]|uniref:DUF1963 domain-containing protein n=1 Tax=Pontibacter mangrovi TaxID=2589816 RepID=A0A501W796_9BACT|nr:YwqG family protein [Pontibacter mangrovi]TPE45178.1 DUF1963 domain-containing protein [Pontibacter mangrovi]
MFRSKKEETVTKPLSFIAQINLSQVTQFDTENLLPNKGILYFFYSAEQEAWGFDFHDRNKFQVLYFDGNTNDLIRADYPKNMPEGSKFKACSVSIQQEISLPSYEHEVYNDFTEEESDKFWEEIYNDENINKLLGYADTIQNDMELECELVTNGLYCGDPSGYNDPRAKALAPNAANWRLLLQIDSNEANEMMWGDCGRLYFWIKKNDLANKQFNNSWFILQYS